MVRYRVKKKKGFAIFSAWRHCSTFWLAVRRAVVGESCACATMLRGVFVWPLLWCDDNIWHGCVAGEPLEAHGTRRCWCIEPEQAKNKVCQNVSCKLNFGDGFLGRARRSPGGSGQPGWSGITLSHWRGGGGCPHRRWIGIRPELSGRTAIHFNGNCLLNSGRMRIRLRCGRAFTLTKCTYCFCWQNSIRQRRKRRNTSNTASDRQWNWHWFYFRKDLLNAQRDYKKKKAEKKRLRMKQLEEEREKEKDKWISFNSKVSKQRVTAATFERMT